MTSIHEGAAIWLLPFFMKKEAAAGLNSRIVLRENWPRKGEKEGALTTYSEVLNYLLITYATDGVMLKQMKR